MRQGSTRLIIPQAPGFIHFKYTDRWSVYDRGPSPQEIPGLADARSACAVHSFRLAQEAGLPTHFVGPVGRRTLLVREFSIPGQPPMSGVTDGRVLPLEWIWRSHLWGSLWGRVQRGDVTAEMLGFPAGTELRKSMKLPKVVQECTTKFEKMDRHLSDAEAMELAELSPEQWTAARELVARAVAAIAPAFDAAGFFLPDGKLELGMTHDGVLVIVDVFGTPDENRVIDRRDGSNYDKDLLRSYLEGMGWKAKLDAAKAAWPDDKSQWPEYPVLPASIIQIVQHAYQEVAWKYVG